MISYDTESRHFTLSDRFGDIHFECDSLESVIDYADNRYCLNRRHALRIARKEYPHAEKVVTSDELNALSGDPLRIGGSHIEFPGYWIALPPDKRLERILLINQKDGSVDYYHYYPLPDEGIRIFY